MRKFLVKVNNQQFEVELEEVKSNRQSDKPVEKISKPSSNGNVSVPTVSANGEKILAPMPGSIIKVNVSKGDEVKRGQVLLVLEAMKMENEITSPADGKVTDIQVEKGQCISAGDVLIVIG